MNIAIFLGKPFSQNTSGRRLLECLSFQVALKHKNTENPPMFPFDLPENPKIIKENQRFLDVFTGIKREHWSSCVDLILTSSSFHLAAFKITLLLLQEAHISMNFHDCYTFKTSYSQSKTKGCMKERLEMIP